ncbi:hypothetical protein IX324_002685 [Bacteroides pyogenes]|nr:hypothetical protein [Bacteroides pyogenes]
MSWQFLLGYYPISSIVASGSVFLGILSFHFAARYYKFFLALTKKNPSKSNLIEFFEFVICSIKNAVSPSFIRNFLQYFTVMNSPISNVYERWNLRFNIIKGMHFNGGFILPELRPPENGKTKINGS